MTGAGWVSQADRARWQRQAAAELAAILDAHPDLPCLSWTVGPAGSVVAGRVGGLVQASRAGEVFAAWRWALALEQAREQQLGGGPMWLRATGCRQGVTVRLTATVFSGQDGA